LAAAQKIRQGSAGDAEEKVLGSSVHRISSFRGVCLGLFAIPGTVYETKNLAFICKYFLLTAATRKSLYSDLFIVKLHNLVYVLEQSYYFFPSKENNY
jgi:hypothetical protein